MKNAVQTVGAKTRVSAETSIVGYRDLLALIQVRTVDDPVGILASREARV